MTAMRVDEHGIAHAVNYVDVDGNVWNKGRDSQGHYVVYTRCGKAVPANAKPVAREVDCMACLVKGAT